MKSEYSHDRTGTHYFLFGRKSYLILREGIAEQREQGKEKMKNNLVYLVPLLAFLLLFSPPLTESKENSGKFNKDYVDYVISTPTVIEGIVIDNEVGKRVENAHVRGKIPSKSESFDMKTDESGHFSKILSNEDNYDNENIVYELSVSKTGYENRKIRGSIEAGGYQFLTIGIDYHPFDINFLENFGSIRRDWIENSYEYVEVEQFTDTMRVVDHYQNKPNYSIRTGSPYYYISQMKDYLSEKSSRELRSFRSRNESFWFDYYQSYGTVTNYEMEKNSFQDFPKGFQYFQGFSDWRRKYIQSSGGTQARVLIPYRFKFLYETGYKKVPVYEEVEYTRCRRKTYRITDYFLDKRENVGNVEIISRNGYDGRAHLKIQANEIDITLEKKHFDLNSSISTPLTLKLDNDIRNKEDRIVVEAMDNNGRVVETQSHDLSIDTEQKPPMENSIVNVVEADEKPDMEGETSTVNKKFVGVKGELRDEETSELLLHGSDDASIRVDMQNLTEYGMPSGRYKAVWPLNYLYEFSLFTYETQEWKMDVRAEAQGYLAETKTARDSTNNQGLTHKNFKLLRKGNNPT